MKNSILFGGLLISLAGNAQDSTEIKSPKNQEWSKQLEIGKRFNLFCPYYSGNMLEYENFYINLYFSKNRHKWGVGLSVLDNQFTSPGYSYNNQFSSISESVYSGRFSQLSFFYNNNFYNSASGRFKTSFASEIFGNYGFEKGNLFQSVNGNNDTKVGSYRVNTFYMGVRTGIDLDCKIYKNLDFNFGMGVEIDGVLGKYKRKENNTNSSEKIRGSRHPTVYNKVGLKFKF